MEKTKVSACIVTYGGYREAAQAAESLLRHTTGVDLSLYLVDNASPDGTGEKLQQAQPQWGPRVQVMRLARNMGFGAGHNAVLPVLNSKYHAVVNPDITLDEDAIGKLCAFLDEHPDAVMATPQLLFPDGTPQYTAKRAPGFLSLLARQVPLACLKKTEEHYLMLDEDLTVPREIDFCTGCFFVVRTDVFRQMQGFDEGYFMYVEDADITRKAQSYGKVYFTPCTHVYHAWHRSPNKSLKPFFQQISSMMRYWRKWGFRLR